MYCRSGCNWSCYKTFTCPSLLTHFWLGAESLPLPPTWHRNLKSGANILCFAYSDFDLGHTGAHFFNISSSKKALIPPVFTFLTSKSAWCRNGVQFFRHLNFQKGVRPWCALYILTWTCTSRHNGVLFFISHLASWLRTRRFKKPSFRHSGATNHQKSKLNRGFWMFSRACIVFLLTLALLWSSLLLFPYLTLTISAFSLSIFILSEVWLLNFLW